ncbi:MAG: hypothetical protein U5K76_03155 [Woeseiaceae bacterium]|nr:hypothetical protein [Woeseiaceae bacterium]
MNLNIKNTIQVLALSLCAIPASADDAMPTFGFDAGLGYQYDSNVNIA